LCTPQGYCDDYRTTVATYYNWFANLRYAGIAPVVSSGNDDYTNAVENPACNSNAISVGNTTLDSYGQDAVLGYVSNGSDSYLHLTLLAPGSDICSSVPNNRWECGWTGTSMAAPHVTGAIAALRQLRPSASVTSIVTALQQAGLPIYDSRNGIKKSRINVASALSYLSTHY
jgi:subtilisin family serine protease